MSKTIAICILVYIALVVLSVNLFMPGKKRKDVTGSDLFVAFILPLIVTIAVGVLV